MRTPNQADHPTAPVSAALPEELAPAEPPVLGHIPWAYGENRVTPMPVDPWWLFVYWELTDDAIERARERLGRPDAGCVLRVYDTTYRLFDGTNANWWMDVPVHRPSNNHYVLVDRPGATLHVDIGVRAGEGAFAPIARSGRWRCRGAPSLPGGQVEWMTVHHEGAVPKDDAFGTIVAAIAEGRTIFRNIRAFVLYLL